MKSLGSIVLVLALVVGVIWLKSADKESVGDDAMEQAIAIVQSLPEYEKHQEFFDSRLAQHHERAFSANFSSGRRMSSLDERSYKIVLLGEFMNDARAEGNQEVLDAMLRELKKIEP